MLPADPLPLGGLTFDAAEVPLACWFPCVTPVSVTEKAVPLNDAARGAVTAMVSVQLGMAVAVKLIDHIGSDGTAWLRLAWAGVILLIWVRPRPSAFTAKTFGMFPKKGTIAVGSDADIVVFDPNRKETISVNNPHTHHMKVDFSTYEGFEVQGYPDTVISRGAPVIE